MTDTYADLVGLSIRAYHPAPQPENIQEGWGVDVEVGGQIDREALRSELQQALDDFARQGHPYELSDRYSVLSWGADAASIIMVVGTTLAGLHSAIKIVEAIANRIGKSNYRPSKEQSPELARHWLSRQLELRMNEIRLEGVDPIEGGFAVTFATPDGRFRVDVLAGAVYRFQKLESGDGEA